MKICETDSQRMILNRIFALREIFLLSKFKSLNITSILKILIVDLFMSFR